MEMAEDDPFLLGLGNFSGAMLNFGAFITRFIGVITPLKTGRGPTLQNELMRKRVRYLLLPLSVDPIKTTLHLVLNSSKAPCGS